MKEVRITVELLGSNATPLYRDFHIKEDERDFFTIQEIVDDLLLATLSEYKGEFDKVVHQIEPQYILDEKEELRHYRDDEVKELNNK